MLDHRLGLAECAEGLGGAVDHDVGAVAHRPGVDAGEGDEPAHLGGHLDERQQLLGLDDDRAQPCLVLLAGSSLGTRVRLLGDVPFHHGDPVGDGAEPDHVDTEAEAIEELRAELSLLGIHGPDQDESRGMDDRHALPLDDVDPHGGRIQEDVDQVVVEEVDLVDVEDVAVGVTQDTRLETALPLLDGALDVESADDPVLGRVDGELDHPHRAADPEEVLPSKLAGAALVAEEVSTPRAAGEAAALDHLDLREQPGEGAHGGGLGGAALAPDQHAADGRVDGVEDERHLHRLLAHQRGEGEDPRNRHPPIVARDGRDTPSSGG